MILLWHLRMWFLTSVALLAVLADGAGADETKLVSGVPQFKLFTSSHSTATAELLAFQHDLAR